MRKLLSRSPLVARVAPFVIFLVLTAAQGKFGPASAYWFYLAKTLVGLWLILEMWPLVGEMRWAFSWEAVLVGVGNDNVIGRQYPHQNSKRVSNQPDIF